MSKENREELVNIVIHETNDLDIPREIKGSLRINLEENIFNWHKKQMVGYIKKVRVGNKK